MLPIEEPVSVVLSSLMGALVGVGFEAGFAG